MGRRPLLGGILGVLLLAACSGDDGPLRIEPCRRPGFERDLRCGTLTVPEDPAQPDGRTVDLNLIVLPAKDGVPRSEAVLYLVGGPGLGATASVPFLASELTRLQQSRDIVLIDQRGTGGSNALICDLPLDEALTALFAGQFELSTLERGLEHLEADPAFYSSLEIVQDLDAARSALGYTKFDVVGISFGSRLGLAYQRAFPQRVRTVALRGVASPAGDLLSDIGVASEDAMRRLFGRCTEDSACGAEFPHLEQTFRRVLARLGDQPMEIEIPRASDRPLHLTVSRDLFAGLVRLSLYSGRSAQAVPQLISSLDQGSPELLTAQLAGILRAGFVTSISFGSYLSIVCAEDMPSFQRTPAPSDDERFFLTASVADNLEAVCRLWPHTPVPPEFKQPVKSSIPTLLMSGTEDPATSVVAAETIAHHFEDSRHLVTPGLAHMPTWTDCFGRNLASFVESGSTATIDESCVADYQPASMGAPR